jgi:hypothetical protein
MGTLGIHFYYNIYIGYVEFVEFFNQWELMIRGWGIAKKVRGQDSQIAQGRNDAGLERESYYIF